MRENRTSGSMRRGERRVMVFSANGHRTRKGGNSGAPPDLYTTALVFHSTERISARRAGPVPAGRPRVAGSVTHSPERSSSSCGRDSGVPLHRLRGCGPRGHPPGLAWWFMKDPG
jgi:hypothetical protein